MPQVEEKKRGFVLTPEMQQKSIAHYLKQGATLTDLAVSEEGALIQGRRLQYNRGTEKTSRTDQERHPAGKDAVPRG